MTPLDFVDPELREALAAFPAFPMNAQSLPQVRPDFLAFLAAQPHPETPPTVVTEFSVESVFGADPIAVWGYQPVNATKPLPAILHLHGGGYVMGTAGMGDATNRILATALNCAIYSVDYRLAPEAPYPAALQDSYSVLKWMHAAAAELGLDPARIGVKGESAGGGLAAALALYARDQKGPPLGFQHLIYPMLDDRTAVRNDLPPHIGPYVWTNDYNQFGWSSLLGRPPGSKDVSAYAAPARVGDVAGLPPTYIAVGGLDLFLEEDTAYAERLACAGVAVEFHLYPGAYHAFDMVPTARVSKAAVRDSLAALQRSLHG
jgi:acetyl esterase/lipase